MTELFDEEEPPISPSPPSRRNYQTTAQFGKPFFSDILYGPKPPSQFQALPSSPKRKLDCIQLEEDDLSQFKRIRLVSKEKRKKTSPFLSYPVGGATFNTAQQQKRDEQTAWDKFHALQASLGNTHPETLTYLHTFTRSLRNWGKYQTAEMIIRNALKSGESELLAHRPEVLQLMLSGLMTILVDQQKLVEADDLWDTWIEIFRTKLGEDSANVVEKQFQQAHTFRLFSSVTWKGAIFDATGQSSVEPLRAAVYSMPIVTRRKVFRGWNGISGALTHNVEVETENYQMKLKENPAPTSPSHPENSLDGQKASDILASDVLSPNSEISAKYQHEHDCSPPRAAKQTGDHSSERSTEGKYSLADFEVLRTLSTGKIARVHLVQSKLNSRFYALKVWKKKQLVETEQVENTCDEIRMLSKVEHPFLMRLWGTFRDSKNLYMVNDFLEGGEMFSLLCETEVRICHSATLHITSF